MAILFSNFLIYTLTISGLISASSSLPTDRFRGPMKQKITHLHLYWHDIHSGSAPTSVPVVNSPPNMTFGFGAIYMIDDPLTLGLKLSSKEVGRAQGFYAWTSQEELSLSMTMSFVLTYGKYNGSTITILGRNPVNMPVRELPVIGGTGLFRFARGYAKIQTLILDKNTGDAVVEYNITVMHY